MSIVIALRLLLTWANTLTYFIFRKDARSGQIAPSFMTFFQTEKQNLIKNTTLFILPYFIITLVG